MILRFDQITSDQLSLVGGKGLNLGRMVRAGLPVPPGFVITTAAYRRRNEDPVPATILVAYGDLGEGAVAVRSSATAEDLQGASFAGQQETFLNVEGEDRLLDAVQACWDSLFTERAIAYRRAQGIPDDRVAMAVIVQRMVPADVAGVLFTREPTTGAPGILIEASWGLGEAIVSGRVTPDRWLLEPVTGSVLESQVAHKTVRITGRGEEPVPDELRSRACLADEELRRLAELGRRVEADYSSPQDIEWALAGGEFYLLQSRPITAAGNERETVRAEEIQILRRRAEPEGTVWARYSLAEVLPEPLPLTWALWRQFMSGRGGYGRMYRELGYDPDPCLDEDGVLDLIAGRPYFNLSRDAKLYFRSVPYDYPFAKLKADPELAIYPTPEIVLAKGSFFKTLGSMGKMAAAEKKLDQAAEEVPELLARDVFLAMAAYAARMLPRDRSALSDAELLASINTARGLIFDQFLPQSLKPGVLAGLAIQKLRAELQPALGDDGARMASDALLAGVAPPPEADLGGALRRLAAGELTRTEFLQQFGHRGPGEMELANPRWRERPDAIPTVASGASPFHASAEAPNLAELIGSKKIKHAAAEAHLARARRFTALRETAKHYLMLGYEVLRLLLLELDRRRGLEGGIFYLDSTELDALVAGKEFRPRIAERRKRRALALGLEAPRVLFSDDLEAIGRRIVPALGSEMLIGTGVSAGAVEGDALVLRSPDGAPPDARDFILVCPSTDPGWVPLFVRARGVVLETGGVLSHGAIVAREFGLPAVVNIPEVCARIRTGQRLRVDGAAGRVWLTP